MEQKEYDKFMRRVRQIHIRLKFKTLKYYSASEGKNLFGDKKQLLLKQSKI